MELLRRPYLSKLQLKPSLIWGKTWTSKPKQYSKLTLNSTKANRCHGSQCQVHKIQEKNPESIKGKQPLSYKGRQIRFTADLSTETRQVSRKWQDNIQPTEWEKHPAKNIFHPVSLSLGIEGERKFPDK